MSAGGTLEDLRLMAQEALALSLDGLREDGAKLPKPSPLARIARLDDAAEAVALIVVPYVPGFFVPKPRKKPAPRPAAKPRKPHTRSAA